MNENFKCEECNSPLVLTSNENKNTFTLECSYCGTVAEQGVVLQGFMSEMQEDN